MALIHCPECGKEISDRAPACPQCGYPLDTTQPSNSVQDINSIYIDEREPEQSSKKSALNQKRSQPFAVLFSRIKKFAKKVTSNKAFKSIRTVFNKAKGYALKLIQKITDKLSAISPEQRSKIKIGIFIGAPILAIAITFITILFSTCLIMHHYSRPTCIEPSKCRICNLSKGVPLGHRFTEEVVTSETCTENGKKLFSCVRCDDEYLEDIAPHPHTPSVATCVEPSICEECTQELSPALGHTISNGTVQTAASCTAEGLMTGKCDACGEQVSEVIPKAKHTPGEWKIDISIGYDMYAEKKRSCTVCGTALDTEDYTLSYAEKGKYLKANCKTYSYNELARYPDTYDGKLVKFKGEVVQVLGSGLNTVLRVNITKGSYFWSDTIYVLYKGKTVNGANICEDDIIWLYGEMDGTETYETILGASVTIPRMNCFYIEFA